MAKKESYNIGNDYDKKNLVSRGTRYCCKTILRHCKRHCYTPDIYNYFGYNVKETSNHLKLKNLNFADYVKNFDNQYILLYQQFSNSISSFNSLLSNLDFLIESKKREIKKNNLKNVNIKTEKI